MGFEVTFFAPADTDSETNFLIQATFHMQDNGNIANVQGAAAFNSTTAVTAIRILAESGNIDDGRCTLYGLAHN